MLDGFKDFNFPFPNVFKYNKKFTNSGKFRHNANVGKQLVKSISSLTQLVDYKIQKK